MHIFYKQLSCLFLAVSHCWILNPDSNLGLDIRYDAEIRCDLPLYSKKLHILVRRPRTSCVTSFTIFPFAFGGIVVNHLASRILPTRIDLNKTYKFS